MAATHTRPRRTHKPRTRHRTSLGLPQLTLGGIAITLLAAYIAVRTWPTQCAVLAGLIATVIILRAVRPRWLTRITGRINLKRACLPAPGHRNLAHFQRLSPGRFEHAIAELALEDDNVHSARQVGQANDRGADVLVHMRDGRRILIQCKKYRHGNNVGSETIQTINGVYRDIHHCHAAVVVTTAGYTRSAHDTNARLPYGIRLVDGPQLEAWANGGTPPWN
jgi:restriction system protein